MLKINTLSTLLTPCYIFDESEFERGITSFKAALDAKFAKTAIGYSVKTNSLPYALKQAHNIGCKAEVVSHDEYRLARLCGYAPNEIIYNGPMKSWDTFHEAVEGGAIVNIETKRELRWLDKLPEGKIYNIGLRLNINISHVSPMDADGDDDNSRFGFSDETSEFKKALDLIASRPKLRLAGLHIHRTAHSRSPRFYENSIRYASSVIKKYNLDIDYIDVGGGYFGIFPNKPTFKDYSESFHRALKESGLDHLTIIVEPGNALTASSFKFLSEVIDKKRIDAKTCFVTTDGSRNDIDPFFKKTDYLKEIIYQNPDSMTAPLQIITGCTCLEYDRLFSLTKAPALEVGDRILYNNVGAYTMTLSPQFIRLYPKVYSLNSKGEFKLVRRESRAEDIINLDNNA